MTDPFRPSALDKLRCEVNSKCESLRAASRLLRDLHAPESDELLLLMAEESFRLARSLEAHRGTFGTPRAGWSR